MGGVRGEVGWGEVGCGWGWGGVECDSVWADWVDLGEAYGVRW